MADPEFPLIMDEDMDDLPRTLRREREEREREARGNDAPTLSGRAAPAPELGAPADSGQYHSGYDDEPFPAVVKRVDIPFLRLMAFFIKAVLAAVPALILLGGIVYLAGEILQTYFPWLIKMRIVILFPDA